MAKQEIVKDGGFRKREGDYRGRRKDELQEKVLVQFAVTPHLKDILEDLKERTGSESVSAVIRDAIGVYLWVVEQYEQGKEVLPKSHWRVERRVYPVSVSADNTVGARSARGG